MYKSYTINAETAELDLEELKADFEKWHEDWKRQHKSFGEIVREAAPSGERYHEFAGKTMLSDSSWARYSGRTNAESKVQARIITTIAVAYRFDILTVQEMCAAAGISFNYFKKQDAAYWEVIKLCQKYELDTADCNVILRKFGLPENQLLEANERRKTK